MEKIKGNDLVFPVKYDAKTVESSLGITKREYFAAMAMQGILANPEFLRNFSDHDLHITSVKNADYLIKELNKEGVNT